MEKSEKELGKKSSIAFVSQIFGNFLYMLFVVMSGRLLGKNAYGDVVYVITILSFIVVITKFGFENSLVAFIARTDITEGQKRWIIRSSIRTSFLLCVTIIFAFFIFRSKLDILTGSSQVDETLFLSIVPFLFFQTMIPLMSAVIRGHKDIVGYCMSSLVFAYLIGTAGIPVFYFVFGLHDAYCLVAVYYASYILNLLYCVHYLWKKGLLTGEKEYFPWKRLLAYSFPLLMAGMVSVLNKEIDQYMVGYFLDSGSVGIYSMAADAALFSSFALMAVNSIFAPMISELYHAGKLNELRSLYSSSTKWVVVVNVMIFGMILVFADDVMHLVGEEFVVGSPVLIIIMLGQLVNSGVGSADFLNSMTGYPKYDMFANVSAVTVNIIMNLLLIRDYGMLGVGAATAASAAIYNIVNFIFMYRHLHMHPYNKRFLGIALAFVCSVPVIFILKKLLDIHFLIRLFISGVIYVVIYGVFIYIFVCDSPEKGIIRSFLRRNHYKG